MKAIITKPVAGTSYKPGDQWEGSPQDFAVLASEGVAVTESEWNATQAVVKAREQRVDAALADAVKAGRFLPKEDTSTVRATALTMESVLEGTGVQYIGSQPVKQAPEDFGKRVTSSQPVQASGTIELGELGLRDTVKAVLHANEPFIKAQANGGVIRAARMDPRAIEDAIALSRTRSVITAKLAEMVANGAEFSAADVGNIVRAGDYADPGASNPVGILNTGLLLQWNLGWLANQLAPIADITTDVSGQPALFNQVVRTRYISVPGVMLKTATNAWSTVPASTTDVNVTMDTHAGVPISFNNNILAATPRQLFNELKAPQMYGLGEYIMYKLIHTAFNGSTRIANDGTTTSTITMNPAYGVFSVAGATLATFTADLPEAMDESKFPGGDEEPGDPNLQRFAWVHGRVYASAAADTNFVINQSLWGAIAKTGENLIETGRFSRLGNIKFRKSQLVTDQCTVSGAGTAASPYTVSAGTFASSTYCGLAGTRNALLFVSRVPLDYTKVLPDVPSTAAVELVTEPKTGLTFMVVKYLDHAYELANLRVQLMFGTAIGDERQGMLLKRTA